jgi:nickel/cobalt tolerance cation efflux system protein
VVSDIQAAIRQNVQLPNGYFIQYGGQFEAEQKATNNLVWYSILAAIIIAILMFFAGACLSGATVAIMLNLPLALVGGIISIVLTGGGDFYRFSNRFYYAVWGGCPQWFTVGG